MAEDVKTDHLERENMEASSWDNVYWYARMLVQTDQFGAFGTQKSKQLSEIAGNIENILSTKHMSTEEKYLVCRKIIKDGILAAYKKDTKAYEKGEYFADAMEHNTQSISDIIAFLIAVRYIVLPTNEAMDRIPDDDKKYCKETAGYILSTLGPEKADRVILEWDNLGTRGCLTAERNEIINEFAKLRTNLKQMRFQHTAADENIVLTAFIQEFERRVGQKRKRRAGGSLEDVTSFLFDYYRLPECAKPEHFQADMEVDKWFKCKDGWIIGISCKRTLRERWKQVSSADMNSMARHKIKAIWHLITYDSDLSDDKIALLGAQNHKFYLSSDSPIYQRAANHPVMKNYVGSLGTIISDICALQQNDFSKVVREAQARYTV